MKSISHKAFRQHKKLILVLSVAALTLLGFIIRSYRLLDFPPSLFIDEYNVGLPALEILNGRYHVPWYGIGWYGTPAMNFYYIASIVMFLGKNEWGLRMAWVIPGSLTIPASYLLFKRIFDEKAALISAFLLAISAVHIHLSRWAHGPIIVSFLLIASSALYAQLKVTKSNLKKILLSLLCSSMLAFMVYNYLGGRVYYVLFWIYILIDVATSWRLPKTKKVGHIARSLLHATLYQFLIFIVSIVLLSPFLYYSYYHPVEFWGRTDQASILNKSSTLTGNLANLGKNIVLYARLFWGASDPNPKHTFIPNMQVFDYVTSTLFIFGVILYAIRNKLRSSPALFLILITLLGGILTVEAPSIFRSVAVIPFVYGFIGFQISFLISKKNLISRSLGLLALASVVVATGMILYQFMLAISSPTKDQYTHFTYREYAIAQLAYEYTKAKKDVFLLFDYYYYSSVKFVRERNVDAHDFSYNIYYGPSDKNIENSKDAILIVDGSYSTLTEYYKQIWPDLKMQVIDTHDIYPIIVYELGPPKDSKLLAIESMYGLNATWYSDESKKNKYFSKNMPTVYLSGSEGSTLDSMYVEMDGFITIPDTDEYLFNGSADDLGGMTISLPDKPDTKILDIPMQSEFYEPVRLDKGIYRIKFTYKNLGGAIKFIITVRSSKNPSPVLIDPHWLSPLYNPQ